MTKVVQVTFNKRRIILLITLDIGCILLGLAIVVFGLTGGIIEFGINRINIILISVLCIIVGAVLVLYYGYALLRNIKNLKSHAIALTLDSSGIHNNTFLFHPETILWRDVKSIHTYDLFLRLGIEFNDYKEYLKSKTLVAKL